MTELFNILQKYAENDVVADCRILLDLTFHSVPFVIVRNNLASLRKSHRRNLLFWSECMSEAQLLDSLRKNTFTYLNLKRRLQIIQEVKETEYMCWLDTAEDDKNKQSHAGCGCIAPYVHLVMYRKPLYPNNSKLLKRFVCKKPKTINSSAHKHNYRYLGAFCVPHAESFIIEQQVQDAVYSETVEYYLPQALPQILILQLLNVLR